MNETPFCYELTVGKPMGDMAQFEELQNWLDDCLIDPDWNCKFMGPVLLLYFRNESDMIACRLKFGDAFVERS